MRSKHRIRGGILKALRDAHGWTQQDVADKINVNIRSYQPWESQNICPSPEYLVKLSKLYSVSTDYLLGLSESRNIGNKEIMDLTGLSENCIEALRFFHSSHYDSDTDKEHLRTIDFINRAFCSVMPSIARFRAAPDEHGPLNTIFSTMMKYVDTKEVSLEFWEEGERKVLSGSVATLDFDGDPTGYTVAELSRVILIERVKNALEEMRTKKEE